MNAREEAACPDSAPPADLAAGTQPWLRLPSESAKAFAAAEEYFKMRDQRSVEAVARKLQKAKSLIARWSATNQWVDRANAYDAWLTQIDLKETERRVKQEVGKWAQRALEQNEEKYRAGQQLLETARTIHLLPSMEQKRTTERYEDGREKTVQVFLPGRVRKVDEIRFAKAGLSLRDEAIRAATSTEVPVPDDYDFPPYIGEQQK
jgi:hypothetical protein